MTLLREYALQEAAERLSELLGSEAKVLQAAPSRRSDKITDGLIEADGFRFAVVYKQSLGAASLAGAASEAKHLAEREDGAVIPLVVVPYIGETGPSLCEQAGVDWLDLSGNARIKAPGLRIWIEGHPNRFKERGRPANVFAPKSARITRWLLTHPDEVKSQRELAQKTGMDEGQTSRVISRLLADDLVIRDSDGTIQVRDRALLLDAWHEHYDISKHQIIKGHMAARSGAEAMERLVEVYKAHHQSYAMTGLPAAWLLTHFAAFRLNTVYLERRPESAVLKELGFREEERGANTWLILPNDSGVLQGAKNRDGVRCVHPVQVYMDLKQLPERAEEAARHLREAILQGSFDAG